MSTLCLDLAIAAGALTVEVALEVPAGGVVIVGPNGAGKSTLLLAAIGARRPRRGRITCDGAVLFDAGSGVDLPPEERRLAYVPQHYALFPHLTAAGNVEFALGCGPAPGPRRQRRARARALLERLGIAHLADRPAARLSGGERQRVALARALATEPRALLLDEPIAALDVEARDEVRRFLAGELAALGRPFVVVTHDRADAAALGASVAVIEGGRVVQLGSLADLARAPATAYVARFAGGAELARDRP